MQKFDAPCRISRGCPFSLSLTFTLQFLLFRFSFIRKDATALIHTPGNLLKSTLAANIFLLSFLNCIFSLSFPQSFASSFFPLSHSAASKYIISQFQFIHSVKQQHTLGPSLLPKNRLLHLKDC